MAGGPHAEDVRSWNDCRATSNIPIPSREGNAMRASVRRYPRTTGDAARRHADLRLDAIPIDPHGYVVPSGATPPGRYASVPFEATLN